MEFCKECGKQKINDRCMSCSDVIEEIKTSAIIKEDGMHNNNIFDFKYKDISRTTQKRYPFAKFIVVFVVIILGVTLISNIDTSSPERDAWICAQNVVRDNLKSPSSAKFCNISKATINKEDDNTWVIRGYVDAENGFGAKIRKDFKVQLELTNSGYKNAYCYLY